MMPMMVPTKTARRCQAWAVTPAGAGMHQMIRPASTEYPRGLSLAPFHSAGAAACTTGAGTDALAATALADGAARHGGHRALTEFGSGGAIALEELRGLADTVTLVRDGVGSNHAEEEPFAETSGACRDASRGGGGRHGGHANRDESATLSDGLKMRHERCSCAIAGAIGHHLLDGTRSRSVSTLRKLLLRFMAVTDSSIGVVSSR